MKKTELYARKIVCYTAKWKKNHAADYVHSIIYFLLKALKSTYMFIFLWKAWKYGSESIYWNRSSTGKLLESAKMLPFKNYLEIILHTESIYYLCNKCWITTNYNKCFSLAVAQHIHCPKAHWNMIRCLGQHRWSCLFCLEIQTSDFGCKSKKLQMN